MVFICKSFHEPHDRLDGNENENDAENLQS